MQGINDPTAVTVQDQWIVFTGTPTFLSATSFSVVGDQTPILQVGRRVKTTNAGGTVYSTISVASFAAGVTTLTLVNDASTLDAGLSSVAYGMLSYTNKSVPWQKGELIGVRQIATTQVYTPTPGTTSVDVELVGGGGAGGGASVTGAGQLSAGAGGSGAGYARSYLTSGFSGVTVTIGAGGVAVLGASGGDGGTTSFGAVFAATGGGGAPVGGVSPSTATTVSQGAGSGAGTGGNLVNSTGQPGGYAMYVDAGVSLGGCGGSSFFGGGALGSQANNGIQSTTPGAGGSGAASNPSTGARIGGNGGAGLCIIREYA